MVPIVPQDWALLLEFLSGRDQLVPPGTRSKPSRNREGRACLVRILFLYFTETTVPMGRSAKSFRATSPGSRMQPWEAG